jgi:rare lipoprotein A
LAKLVKTALCIAVASAFAVGVPRVCAADDNIGKAAESSRSASSQQTQPPQPDLSARKRVGKASFYAKQFFGKPMANGAPMDPQGNNAASRTLPLGTTAKVTNVETGKTAIVRIEDRGPYVDGRVVDLSPGTAEKIGLTPRKGITKVVVAPITVPMPDGKVKMGAAAHEPLSKPDELPLRDEQPPGKEKKTELASVEPPGGRHEK